MPLLTRVFPSTSSTSAGLKVDASMLGAEVVSGR